MALRELNLIDGIMIAEEYIKILKKKPNMFPSIKRKRRRMMLEHDNSNHSNLKHPPFKKKIMTCLLTNG